MPARDGIGKVCTRMHGIKKGFSIKVELDTVPGVLEVLLQTIFNLCSNPLGRLEHRDLYLADSNGILC